MIALKLVLGLVCTELNVLLKVTVVLNTSV